MGSVKKLTLKEYKKKAHTELFSCSSEVIAFEKYLESQGLDKALEVHASYLKASSYVGSISFNGKLIEVVPKILGSKNEDESSKEEKERMMRNLLFMLNYTNKLNIESNEIHHFSTSNASLLEVFMYLFSKDLLKQLKRELPHSYERKQENLSFIRGKIKFQDDFKKNSHNRSKTYCEYPNYQRDNIYTQTFLFVANKLKKMTGSELTLRNLNSVSKILDSVSNKHTQYRDISSKEIGRSYRQYKTSFNFCKLFLKNSSPTLSEGSFDNFSILFNMNDVFEEFIFEFIYRNKENICPNIEKIEFQRGRKLFSAYENLDSNEGKIVKDRRNINNDIRLSFSDRPTLIIDTKYKIIESPFEISTSDSFQMFMYSHLENNMTSRESNLCLLYPETERKINYVFDYKGSHRSLSVNTIDLNTEHDSLIVQLRTLLDDYIERASNA